MTNRTANEKREVREITPAEQMKVAGGIMHEPDGGHVRDRGEGSCIFPRELTL